MTTFVLVPGAGGHPGYWQRLVPELAARGHHAVPVDLPADDDTKGLADYADLIAAAIGDRPDVVLVAQSFGGFSAPLACTSTNPAQLVLVNAMIPAPGESAADWGTATGSTAAREAAAERDGRSREFDFVADFFHDVPADVTAAILADGERDQSATPFAEPWPLDGWPDVPTRVVVGRDDRLFPADFQRRVARERLGLDADELPGGHLIALSRPRELADYLVNASSTSR